MKFPLRFPANIFRVTVVVPPKSRVNHVDISAPRSRRSYVSRRRACRCNRSSNSMRTNLAIVRARALYQSRIRTFQSTFRPLSSFGRGCAHISAAFYQLPPIPSSNGRGRVQSRVVVSAVIVPRTSDTIRLSSTRGTHGVDIFSLSLALIFSPYASLLAAGMVLRNVSS